jgi:hypothetical protein
MLNPIKTLFGAVAALTASTRRIPNPLRRQIDDATPARSMFDEKRNATFGWSRHVNPSPHGRSFGGTGTRYMGGYYKGQPGAKLIRKMIRRYGYVPVMLTQPAVRQALAAKAPKVVQSWRTEAVDASKPVTDDYIDWSKVPEGYDWVAVDSPEETAKMISRFQDLENNQGVGMFTEKPEIWRSRAWNSPDGNYDDTLVPSSAIIGPLPPWRESLRHRPATPTERTTP